MTEHISWILPIVWSLYYVCKDQLGIEDPTEIPVPLRPCFLSTRRRIYHRSSLRIIVKIISASDSCTLFREEAYITKILLINIHIENVFILLTRKLTKIVIMFARTSFVQ
jgi:hypothetical protein